MENILSGAAPTLPFNPIEAAFEEVKVVPEKKPDDINEGIFLLFHGPANTRKFV